MRWERERERWSWQHKVNEKGDEWQCPNIVALNRMKYNRCNWDFMRNCEATNVFMVFITCYNMCSVIHQVPSARVVTLNARPKLYLQYEHNHAHFAISLVVDVPLIQAYRDSDNPQRTILLSFVIVFHTLRFHHSTRLNTQPHHNLRLSMPCGYDPMFASLLLLLLFYFYFSHVLCHVGYYSSTSSRFLTTHL